MTDYSDASLDKGRRTWIAITCGAGAVGGVAAVGDQADGGTGDGGRCGDVDAGGGAEDGAAEDARVGGGRADGVVFDPVGGEVFENSMRCINWGARLLVIGFTGGIGSAKTNLLLIKGASVLGVRAGEAVRKNPARGEKRLKDLLAWAEAGKLRPNVSHRLPLQDYAKAMRLLIGRKAIGRVALVMN